LGLRRTRHDGKGCQKCKRGVPNDFQLHGILLPDIARLRPLGGGAFFLLPHDSGWMIRNGGGSDACWFSKTPRMIRQTGHPDKGRQPGRIVAPIGNQEGDGSGLAARYQTQGRNYRVSVRIICCAGSSLFTIGWYSLLSSCS